MYTCIYCIRTVLHSVRDITRYWSKITNFNLPHLYLVPLFRSPHWNFANTFGARKLESLGIVSRCLRDDMFSRYDSTLTCVGQTDRQTDTRP